MLVRTVHEMVVVHSITHVHTRARLVQLPTGKGVDAHLGQVAKERVNVKPVLCRQSSRGVKVSFRSLASKEATEWVKE